MFPPLERNIEIHMDVPKPSIWKMFPRVTSIEAQAYEPKMVHIGPLHAEKSTLTTMTKVKFEYFTLCR